MTDQDDNTNGLAIAVVLGVVAAVVAGVLTLAASHLKHRKVAAAPAVAAVAAPAEPAPVAAAPAAPVASAAVVAVERVYFAVGADALPADAAAAVERIAAAAKPNAWSRIQISGFHDASGDPARNAELAKNRAFAVRRALQDAGVPEGQLEMSKPEVTTGGADPREARRVEMRLR